MRLDLIGLLLILVGIAFLIISTSGGDYAIVGFIGPIPFGFGNNPKLVKTLLIISFVIIILLLILSGVLNG